MRLGRSLLLLSLLLGVPRIACAQEAGQKGLTMGFPESIGLLWHVTDKVAVRPEFGFAHVTTDSNLPFTDGNVSSTSIGVGVSALFYLKDYDNLRTYVAPRWVYNHTDPGGGTTSSANTISGLFGAQYALGKRFSVFGEAGLAFSHSTAKSEVAVASIIDTIEAHGNSIGTHTGVGVILYF